MLRVHTRVADLYNQPMNQIEQQLRLTVEALRERQEHETGQQPRVRPAAQRDRPAAHPHPVGAQPRTTWTNCSHGAEGPKLFLAHPRAIAAFGRECSKRGSTRSTVDCDGHQVPAWRGVPMLPVQQDPGHRRPHHLDPLHAHGREKQGVVGLHQTGIPDEYQPGLSVRFMGINEQAIISYLVSAYYSAAVLVPDALGILENVEIGHWR